MGVKTCVRGHSRVPDNVSANGSCRECNRMFAKRSSERRREAAGKAPRAYNPGAFPCGHPRDEEHSRTGKNECAVCHRARQAARYNADPQAARAAASAYQKTNRAAATARQRQWRRDNQEHYRAYTRMRARSRRLVPKGDTDTSSWIDIISLDPCSYCGGATEHIDHIRPVSRGGANHWSNYTPACSTCNTSKHAKQLLTFLLGRVAA